MPSTPPEDAGSAPLTRRDRLGIALLVVLFLGLGIITDIRSAFQNTPKTDFQVYARAAWAGRSGEDLYTVADDNGWHYVYPPAFAIVLVPLADPYPFASRKRYLTFCLSATISYLLRLLC